MTIAANGPVLDQRAIVFHGSSSIYTIPIFNPDRSKLDFTVVTAASWVEPFSVGQVSDSQFCVTKSPDAFTKALPVLSDVFGGFRVILAIDQADFTEVDKAPDPATIGPLAIHRAVKDAAA